jgi:H+-translocating NAD(P) transhydrogenase subunit alpha
MAENNATTIGVVKESVPGETRVGLIPDSVKHLTGKGMQVVMQAGAGENSSISDSEYEQAGARIVASLADVHQTADVVVRVQSPAADRGELDGLRHDQILVSFLAPLVNHDLNRKLAESGVTAMAVDAVPRITRAQSMDALSAMSTIAGYKAVLLAAEKLPKFFPLLMTAAGTIRPAKVLVLGAGVAGLQAIATARRLGAVVEAYDVRAVVKEQVESLGAKFVEIDTGAGNAEAAGGYAREATPEELKRQQEGLNDHIASADVVITTALVPGRPAPKMIPASAVERMRHGSVIVDLAAEAGGNCELTTPGEVTTEHGVTIVGTMNLPATLPVHASQMYARVITNFLDLLVKDGAVNLNLEDEIIAGMAITRRGEIVQAQTRKMMGLDEQAAPQAAEASSPALSGADDAADAESTESDDSGERRDFDEAYVPDDDDGSEDNGHHALADSEGAPGTSESAPDADTMISNGGSGEMDDYNRSDSAADDAAMSDETPDEFGEPVTFDVSDREFALVDTADFEPEPGSEISQIDQFADDLAGEDENAVPTGIAANIDITDPADIEPGAGSDMGAIDPFAEELTTPSPSDSSLPDDVMAETGDASDTGMYAESVLGSDTDDESSESDLDYESLTGVPASGDVVFGRDNETGALDADDTGTRVESVDFDEDGNRAGSVSSVDAEFTAAKTPTAGADATPRNSRLPEHGEGTDWVAGDGTQDVPDGFPIKGNANSGLYHPKESHSYENTRAEIYFASAEAAESHGYRLPKAMQQMNESEEESNTHE